MGEYFNYGHNRIPQTPLMVKSYHKWVTTTINVTCEKNHTANMSTTIYVFFNVGKYLIRAKMKVMVGLR